MIREDAAYVNEDKQFHKYFKPFIWNAYYFVHQMGILDTRRTILLFCFYYIGNL